MKKIISIIFFMLILTGCGANKYEAYYTDVFDTFSTFSCYCDSKEEFDSISEGLHTMLKELNDKMDIYNDYDGLNNLKTINDNAGIKPVKVDKDVIEIIKIGKEAYYDSDGTINIAMGSVLEIWHKYRETALDKPENASIPRENELNEANKYTNIENIVIDEESSTVFIKDKNTQIDIGALAKGYCCDKAKEYLEKQGVKAALLNLGGNVICINDQNIKPQWKIGVQDPDNEKEYIEEYSLTDQSAVTSGNYQRYYDYNGVKYHHIIDPKTLMPAQSNKSVTIISDSSTKGDIYSTALFILPYDEGKELADKNNIKALWITSTGEIIKN